MYVGVELVHHHTKAPIFSEPGASGHIKAPKCPKQSPQIGAQSLAYGPYITEHPRKRGCSGGLSFYQTCSLNMVGVVGLEPTASWSRINTDNCQCIENTSFYKELYCNITANHLNLVGA